MKALACATLLLLSAAFAAHAQVARMEILSFPTLSLSDQVFLTGGKDGKAATITGSLRLPRGNDRAPVVILLHGSGGISGYVTDWEQEFNDMGIATFVVDSWTGRGITTTVFDQSLPGGRLTQLYDAYRALEAIEKHPRVDPERIAVMGFSRGGQASLYAASKRFQRLHGAASGREFAAYIALYPTCVGFRDDEAVSAKPIRIHHGAADDYVPSKWCRAYAQRLKAKGADVEHAEYAGAHHVYDWKALAKPSLVAKGQTTRNCELAEGTDSRMMNVKSGQPFTYADPCVEYGVTTAYDEKGSEATRKAVRDLLRSTFKLPSA
jgi:dienelactone hydrolase